MQLLDDFETRDDPERAVLVAIKTPNKTTEETAELLAELAELSTTLGVEIVDQMTVSYRKPHSQFLVGSGSAQQVVDNCTAHNANLIIFDDELSPSQQRNWEKLARIRVIDRQEVILDIFAARARTREAVLQIELARTEYMLPRLKRAWTHLSRQQGGVGVRGGEGEKQLEVDARLVRRRISRLRRELEVVRKQRAEQRKKRRQVPVPTAAIVGYTNAGKSSLLNRLTNANTLVEDKLFATLDPTTRRIALPNNQTLLLTDTVGFIRNLPHGLVESFKATLEEAVLADFLIHVVDASSPYIDDHLRTTSEVLSEIGAADKFTIVVLNKTDLVTDPFVRSRLQRVYCGAFFVSVRSGDGIDKLVDELASMVERDMSNMTLRIPQSHYDVVASIHRTSNVLSETYEDDGDIVLSVSVPRNCCHEFAAYQID